MQYPQLDTPQGRHTKPSQRAGMLAAALYAEVCMAALAGPGPHPGRRAALGSAAASLSLTLGRPPLAAHAAAPIEKGAPAFGTSESRTGLLDGIKSAFSEKTGAARRSAHTSHGTRHTARVMYTPCAPLAPRGRAARLCPHRDASQAKSWPSSTPEARPTSVA